MDEELLQKSVLIVGAGGIGTTVAVSYTHLRAHET